MLPIAILAGGLATRLRPITATIPKSLIEIAGRPFICWQLELLRKHGFQHVVLCVGYLGEQIQAVVGDGSSFGMRVQYSFDGPQLLGTGGAVMRAIQFLGDKFFVMYGDSYLLCDFEHVQSSFENSGKPALMTVLRNENRWDKSNVLFQEGRLIEYNKFNPSTEMSYIDYGLGILTSESFKSFSGQGAFDLAELYQDLSLTQRLAGFEVTERFFEIGSLQGISEAEAFLLSKGN